MWMKRLAAVATSVFLIVPAMAEDDGFRQKLREGIRLHDSGDYDAALDVFRDLLRTNPNHSKLLYEFTYTTFSKGDYQGAVELAEQALKKPDARRVQLHILLGSSYDALGEWKKGEKAFRRGIEESPDDFNLHYNLGVNLLNQERMPKAVEEFKAALRHRPAHASSWLALATTGDNPAESLQCLMHMQQRAVLYEPVVVSYALRNGGNEPVDLIFDANAALHFVSFYTTGKDGIQKEYRIGVGASAAVFPRTMKAGDGRESQIMLTPTGAPPDFVFSELGSYEVEVRCQFIIDKSLYTLSTSQTVTIVEPTEADQAALKLFGSADQYRDSFLTGQFCKNRTKGKKCYEEMLSIMRAGSAYAPTLCKRLSSRLSSGFFGLSSEEDLAFDVSKECVERWPSHPIAPWVVHRLVRMYIRTGERADAEAWLARFEARWPLRRHRAQSLRDHLPD